MGLRVAFPNAYPTGYMDRGGRGTRRPGAFPLAAHAAGLLVRTESEVRNFRAVVSGITTETWRQHVDPRAPVVEPVRAGRVLAEIASDHDLTVFAHYDTDLAGHGRDLHRGVVAIERVDAFLGGLVQHLPSDLLLLVTSDHGNLEDTTVGHTSNDVPLLTVGVGGPAAVERIRSIREVTPFVLDLLESRAGRTSLMGSG
ncbi:MAG: hypothetical protein GEU90_03625 [Gemmatimonas sp.]|nr:hypothetical protein [Gemmatimonas sp.]